MHREFYKRKKAGEREGFGCLKDQSTVVEFVKSRLSLSAMSNYCQGVYIRRRGDSEPHLHKSITRGGKIRVAAFKLFTTKSFVFPKLKA